MNLFKRDTKATVQRGARIPFQVYQNGSGLSGMSGGDVWSNILGGLPGDSVNWMREAGLLHENSIVASAVNWLQLVGPESPACLITKQADGEEKVGHDHPVLDLLRRPNAYYSGSNLEAALWLSFVTAGNAYILKRGTTNMGQPQELWYEPHWNMRACWPRDGSEWISHYQIKRNGVWLNIDKADVIHLRNGVDPANERYGRNPIHAALRLIAAANEAETFTWATTKNMGVLGVLLMPEDPTITIQEPEALALTEKLERWYTGIRRGRPLIPTVRLKLEQMGITPNDMALDRIFPQLEASICSLLHLPPVVLGLKVGLDRATDSAHDAAIREAYRSCIMPLKKLWAEELTMQLLVADYFAPSNVRLDYDYSKVRELQDDEDAKVKRLVEGAGGAILTVDEARGELGLPPMGGDSATIRVPVVPPKDNAPGDPAASKNAAHVEAFKMLLDRRREGVGV